MKLWLAKGRWRLYHPRCHACLQTLVRSRLLDVLVKWQQRDVGKRLRQQHAINDSYLSVSSVGKRGQVAVASSPPPPSPRLVAPRADDEDNTAGREGKYTYLHYAGVCVKIQGSSSSSSSAVATCQRLTTGNISPPSSIPARHGGEWCACDGTSCGHV